MYGPVQGLTVSAGNSDRQLTCAEYDLQDVAALFGFVDVLEDKKSTKEARQSVGLRRRPRAGDLLRRLPVIAQPVLSFLQRERKLRTRDAGGYPCATCDDAKASVVRTFANFFQSISFGFGIAGDALFLRVAHGGTPGRMGLIIHETRPTGANLLAVLLPTPHCVRSLLEDEKL